MKEYFILYETTNLINGKKYRGIHKTNNLEDGYLGSGLALTNAVNKYGKENFKRDILEYCSDYDELLEREKIYVDIEWVECDNNYNLKTGGQSAGILSQESRDKLSQTLKEKYASGELDYVINIIKDRNTGRKPWNKGKTASEVTKQKLSKSLKGREPWNKGLKGAQVAWNKGLDMGKMSEEEKKKRSDTLKKRYAEQEHHSKGTEPWNKGLKGAQVAWNKGKKMKKYKCDYCDAEMDLLNLNKWHNENCKHKIEE